MTSLASAISAVDGSPPWFEPVRHELHGFFDQGGVLSLPATIPGAISGVAVALLTRESGGGFSPNDWLVAGV
jgi:hypothetical protein